MNYSEEQYKNQGFKCTIYCEDYIYYCSSLINSTVEGDIVKACYNDNKNKKIEVKILVKKEFNKIDYVF